MPLITRDECLLVVVDVQPRFVDQPWFDDEMRAASAQAVQRIAWLTALAARIEIPTVVTEEVPEANGATDPRVAEHLTAGTPVLRKPTFGLAGSPEILEAVRATKRTTAVFVGCETDVCVAQSAIGLRSHGFRCVAVDDACFSPGEMHARGLARMAGADVERNHTKGVAFEWVATVDDAKAILHPPGLPEPGFHL